MNTHISVTSLAILLSLFATSSASICRNLTNTSFSSDGPSQFSNTNITPLENVNCPAKPSNGTCYIPRGIYNINVHRKLNISVSSEDEDAIFELARVSYWTRSPGVNQSLWDPKWTDLERTVDTRESSPDRWSSIFFDTEPGINYTLYFLAFTRWGSGTLAGCDNATLNGMGVNFAVPYEAKDARNGNVTDVAGTLYGSGTNTTKKNEKNAAVGLHTAIGHMLSVTVVLGLGFALLL